MRRQWTLIGVLAAMVFVLSLPSSSGAQKRGRSTATSRKVRAPQPRSVDQFKDAFQNDSGKVRLVALISPT